MRKIYATKAEKEGARRVRIDAQGGRTLTRVELSPEASAALETIVKRAACKSMSQAINLALTHTSGCLCGWSLRYRAELYRERLKALMAAGGKKIIVELSPESNAVLQKRVAETGQTQTAVINGLLSGWKLVNNRQR